MSPKSQSYTLMLLSILIGVGPHVPDLMSGSGLNVSPWVKFACALIAAAGGVVGYRLPAQKNLANSDGENSSGGPGVKLSGAPHSDTLVSTDAASSAVRPASLFIAGVLALGACTMGCGANPPSVNTITTQALSIEGLACFIDELVDPLLPVGDAQTIAVFIQGACAKNIPQSLTNLISQLITGLMAPGPDGGAAPLMKYRGTIRVVPAVKP